MIADERAPPPYLEPLDPETAARALLMGSVVSFSSNMFEVCDGMVLACAKEHNEAARVI